MASNKKQITVKVCEWNVIHIIFDKDVLASLIDFFSRDSHSTINRISDETMLKYCHNCLKEKFVRKNPSIVSDSRWIDLRIFNDCYKNVAVPSSGCLARFLRDKNNFLKFVITVNFVINTI